METEGKRIMKKGNWKTPESGTRTWWETGIWVMHANHLRRFSYQKQNGVDCWRSYDKRTQKGI